MIGFRLQKGFLDISPSVQLSLTATNPFLDPDHMGRAYTFDFNAERTPQNDKLFSHLYRLDSNAEAINLPCRCYLNGYEFETGKLSVQEIQTGYKCYFQSDALIAAEAFNKNLSYYITDTLQLFTNGPVPFDLEWFVAFLPEVTGGSDTVALKIRGQLFEFTINWDTGLNTPDYHGAAITLQSLLATELPDLTTEIYNYDFLKIIATDGELVPFEIVEHCAVYPLYDVEQYEITRIHIGVKALIQNSSAAVAFPPIYAPSVHPDNALFQKYKILNNLEAPDSFSLFWQISFIPDAGTATQSVSVKVQGQIFELSIYYDDSISDYNYFRAAADLARQLTSAFPLLVSEVYQGVYVKIESPTGAAVVIVPIERTATAVLNVYSPNLGELRINKVQATKIWANSIVPMLKLSYILSTIATKLGLILSGEVWLNEEFKKLILFNSVTLDDIIEITPIKFINRWKKSIVLANHIPDITVKDLLNYLSEQFGIYYTISGGYFNIRYKKDLHAKSPQNWTDIIISDPIIIKPKKQEGINIHYQHDKDAPTTEYPTSFDPITIGEGGIEYVMPFDTLPVINFDAQGFKRLPHWYGKIDQTPKMLLLLRGGIFANDNTKSYQFATNDDKNYTGAALTGSPWSLALSGTNGLYEKHLKTVIPYLDAEEVKIRFTLKMNHLTELRKGNISRVFSQTPQGEFTATIDQINLKIQNNRIDSATVDFKKI